MSALRVRLKPAGLGQDVPTVTSAIKNIKLKVRGTLNTLSYNLPIRWLMCLVQFMVTKINCMPMRRRHGWHGSKQMSTGIKFIFRRDCHIGFGEYVQAVKPKQITNTMHASTEGAISLISTDGIAGSVRFMCLRTLKPIVRTQWTVLHIPQVQVDFINKLSSEGSKKQGIPPKVVHITVRKGLQQYADKAHGSTVVEWQQQVDKSVFIFF